MATAKEIAANKKRKLKIAEKKAADVVKFKAKKAADKAKAAEKAKAAKAKAKVAKDLAKAKKIADKAEAKRIAALPVTLTEQQMDLATTVNKNQEIIISSGNSMIMTAMDSGVKLTKLKDAVKAKKGKWEVWMKENLILSDRQCQKYMKLATEPGEVKKLLKEMGEDASINAICGKIGQLKLTNEQIEEREEAKTAAANAKSVAISFKAILEECDKMDLDDLQELKAYVQDRIDQYVEGSDTDEEDTGDDTDADDQADIDDHVDPVS